ncbi:UPF0045 protein ECM15 [Penicillium brasilianum]|uniref:UPF0045 protein ECM15 n=1 Tax=Penicillium brasilianum TaxID=104259 RepID=A0A1S9RAZ9_PENBI|nr:UPF0045 protein ECM15 [Penicillium brasilianum]
MSIRAPSADTPSCCTADFSLIPIGSSASSYAHEIAGVQRLVRESGLKNEMHATGTRIEGPWDLVMRLIGTAHTCVHHSGIPRIQTDVRMLTRTDKDESVEEGMQEVEKILVADV